MNSILLAVGKDGEQLKLKNDLVYIFAGGELANSVSWKRQE